VCSPLTCGESVSYAGDSLLCFAHNTLGHYRTYIEQLRTLITRIDELSRARRAFAAGMDAFDARADATCSCARLLMTPVYRVHAVWTALVRKCA
jgi:hypothetical protein